MNPEYCLIVDDHTQLRNLLCDWLKSTFPAINFIEASSGEAALELMERYQPQVVLMDIGLPGINGIEATRRIKVQYPQTFVIIHTIHTAQAYLDDADSAGADIFISKSKIQKDLVPTLVKVFAASNNEKHASP